LQNFFRGASGKLRANAADPVGEPAGLAIPAELREDSGEKSNGVRVGAEAEGFPGCMRCFGVVTLDVKNRGEVLPSPGVLRIEFKDTAVGTRVSRAAVATIVYVSSFAILGDGQQDVGVTRVFARGGGDGRLGPGVELAGAAKTTNAVDELISGVFWNRVRHGSTK
jgi:hypothetical protein